VFLCDDWRLFMEDGVSHCLDVSVFAEDGVSCCLDAFVLIGAILADG